MKNIVINRNNIVAGSNNSKFQYNFPSTQNFDDYQVSLAQLTMAISWVNISGAYNNDQFAYVWFDAGGPTLNIVPIASGFYTIDQLSAYLHGVMYQYGHYLVDDTGNNVFYIDFVPNLNYVSMEIRCRPIPTALPLGWSNPALLTFPAVATTPLVVIPATNFQTYTGFPTGVYPSAPQPTIYNGLSPNVPNIAYVNNIIIKCSLVDNQFQYPSDVLDTFIPLGQSGFAISYEPRDYIFTEIRNGYYSSFTIEFVDQNLRPVAVDDPDIFMQLILKRKDQSTKK